jgi:hypothetical protein
MSIRITARDRLLLNKLSHAFVISDIWTKVFKPKLNPAQLAEIEAGKSQSLIDVYFDKCPDVKAVWQTLQQEMPKVHKALAKEFGIREKGSKS